MQSHDPTFANKGEVPNKSARVLFLRGRQVFALGPSRRAAAIAISAATEIARVAGSGAVAITHGADTHVNGRVVDELDLRAAIAVGGDLARVMRNVRPPNQPTR
jgi:hypothetical protein